MYDLDQLRRRIDAHIMVRLDTLPAELGVDVSANGRDVYARLQQFALRPGKRIRGALAMVSYDMFGGRNQRVALDLALAVELIQNYLLIVDDVMDRSELRRGGATLHRQYRERLRRRYPDVSAEHIGNMLAVNAGLIDHHLSMLVLSKLDAPAERVVHAQQLFQTNIAATGFGQMDDLWNEAGQGMSQAAVRHMYMLKSSYYSFVNPLQLGAVLAGAVDGAGVQHNASQARFALGLRAGQRPAGAALDALRQYGEQAGLAFQLQDDILGMFGNAKTTGKSAMDDLREGKRTLLIRHGLARANEAQAAVMHAALGNPDVTARQHAAVKQILIDTGSRAYVTRQAKAAARRAHSTLEAQDWSAEGTAFLEGMLDYIIDRKA